MGPYEMVQVRHPGSIRYPVVDTPVKMLSKDYNLENHRAD